MSKIRLVVSPAIGALTVLAACGPGSAGKAVRPNDPTATGALEEGSCHEVGAGGEPLVVDWKPEQRGDLEIAMREGVAVVSYDCSGIKLLKDCHLNGSYGYLGMTRKEQVVRLSDSDEVRANLPLSGVKLGAELKRGASIDVAMVMVGKQKTTWTTPTKADLQGSCEGASHFVRGATVGAFVLETNTSGEAKAVASFFGAEAGGASASKRQVQNKDGDLGSCKSASPSSANAPDQCGAPIRLLIAPIAKDAAAAKPAAKGADLAHAEVACPSGLVWAEGKCTKPDTAPAYQCRANDAKECSAQCDKGHAGSCGTLGVLYVLGSGVGADVKKAAELFDKGCKGGDVPSCVNRGRALFEGSGVAKDEAGAAALFEQACTDGDATGCGYSGLALLEGRGVSKDTSKAAKALQQACEGGHYKSCGRAAVLFATGDGVTKDEQTALKFHDRACQGGDGASCEQSGLMYELGRGIGKNAMLASFAYDRGCILGTADACYAKARVELSKSNGANKDEAKRVADLGCMRGSVLSCSVMKVFFGGTTPVIGGGAAAMDWRRACDKQDPLACTKVGVTAAASGNKAEAGMYLTRACSAGDAFACEVQKAVK